MTTENLSESQRLIAEECDAIKNLLLEKNRKYGDSALSPSRTFSKASAEEQLLVRIDDKLSRIKNAQDDDNEDAVQDLIGYLVLLRVARAKKRSAGTITIAFPDDNGTGLTTMAGPGNWVGIGFGNDMGV